MNEEIRKLAEDLGCEIPSGPDGCEFFFYPAELEAFYRAAYRAGLEAAAEVCEQYETRLEEMRDSEYQAELAGRQMGAVRCAAAIRALKEQV